MRRKFKVFAFLFVICHFAFAAPEAILSSEATPSSEEKARQILEAVRERIRERQLTAQRRAYVGTLKSIADTTLILECKDGIKQAEVSTEAAIIRISAKTKKEIKFEDLVLGDLTIAMGYLDDNEVLEAKRVIIQEKPEEVKRKAIYGLVEKVDVEEKAITIKGFKKEEIWSLKITSKTEITKKIEDEIEKIKLQEIEPGDRLIAIGTPEEEENLLTTHRIHLIPGKPE